MRAMIDNRSDRAHAAAKAASKMLPSITAFVRMLTKNPKIKVKWTGGTPRTDGETVWLRVPIGLGDKRDHVQSLCGKRDEDLIQRCEACAAEEDLWITMIHECAHVIFDTFAAIPDESKRDLLKQAIQTECNGKADSRRAQIISQRIERYAPSAPNFLGLAGIVSPWLPMLINACEDVRVNLLMKEARPGTLMWFAAQTNSVFKRGIEQEDGSIYRWSDQPLNAQAFIGIYCKTSGLNYSGWLDPKVVADLDDPELSALIRRMRTARSVKAIYEMSFPLLENLRRLGYMLSDEDPQDEPEPTGGEEQEGQQDQEDPQDGDEAEGEDEGDGGSAEDGDAGEQGSEQEDSGQGSGKSEESDRPGNSAGQPEPGQDRGEPDDELDQYEEGEGSGDADEPDDYNGSESDGQGTQGGGQPQPKSDEDMGDPDEVERIVLVFGRHEGDHDDPDPSNFDSNPFYMGDSDERSVEIALSQADHFDKPSTNLDGLVVHRFDQRSEHAYGGAWWNTPDEMIDLPEVPERILAPALQRLRIAFADNRAASTDRNRKSGRINAKVLGRRVPVGDDRLFAKKTVPSKKDYFVVVGLDVSGSTCGREIDIIKAAAFAKAELLSRLGVKFAVYAHTGRSRTVGIYEVKSPTEAWGLPQKRALAALQSAGGNYDGHSVEFYRKVAQSQVATDKIILYYTDGALNNIGEEFDVFTENVNICKKSNITLVGVEIGVNSGITEMVGLDTIRLDAIEDVPKVVDGLRKRLM